MIAALRRGLGRASAPADHNEFLASALEITRSPPSPAAVGLMGTIALAVAAALAWSVVGQTDVVAIAHGKLQPAGRVKVIQPLEPGRVHEIRVANGDRVAAGDVLVLLDDEEAQADVKSLSAALVAAQAEALRRGAALAAAAGDGPPDGLVDVTVAWPVSVPEEARQREETVLRADLGQIAGLLGANAAQRAQKEAEIARLRHTIVAQQELIDVLQERVDTRNGLAKTGNTTRASVIDAQETLAYHRTTLASQLGQVEEAEAALLTLAAERRKLTGQFLAEQADKRLQAQKQADDLVQRLAKARTRLDRLTLRSPVEGVVQSLAVTTLGQVLSSAQELMRVVPQDAGLEVELYLPNRDAGFVHEGQPVSVKLEAFPFTRFGTLRGAVARVGRDAIPEPDAMATEADGTRAQDGKAPAGAQRVGRLVFPVTVALEAQTISVDGRPQRLSPGLAATGEIKVRQRRIIDYLLSPLREVTSEAMREM